MHSPQNKNTDKWLSELFKYHNFDSELERRCEILWLAKEYDACITQASKVLESRYRKILGEENEYGVRMIEKLFNPASGLITVFNNRGQQEGFYNVLKGFFQLTRNQFAHSFVDPEANRALEYICCIDIILHWIGLAISESLKQKGLIDKNSDIAACISADVNLDKKTELIIANSIKANANLNLKRTIVRILSEIIPNIKQNIILEVEDVFDYYLLVNVEDINKDEVPEIIIEYPAGAHGHWMHIYRWNGCSYIEISPDGEGFFSDAGPPHINDEDNDGLQEVITQIRDYATNPMKYCYRTIFKWSIDKYILSKKKRVNW